MISNELERLLPRILSNNQLLYMNGGQVNGAYIIKGKNNRRKSLVKSLYPEIPGRGDNWQWLIQQPIRGTLLRFPEVTKVDFKFQGQMVDIIIKTKGEL